MAAEGQSRTIRQANPDQAGLREFGELIGSPLFSDASALYSATLLRSYPDDISRGEPVMTSLVWNNFLAGWLCFVLLSLALGIYISSDKQRPHDAAWRFTVAGCTISTIISIFMLLYDVSIWLYIY